MSSLYLDRKNLGIKLEGQALAARADLRHPLLGALRTLSGIAGAVFRVYRRDEAAALAAIIGAHRGANRVGGG